MMALKEIINANIMQPIKNGKRIQSDMNTLLPI
jgi:hypothetical protein